MFTIKQLLRNPDRKGEDRVNLFEGMNPSYATNPETGKPHVTFQMPDLSGVSLDSGVIFVMNASGKTVDTFRLEGSDWY